MASVTYLGNGHTGGSVPTDGTNHALGAFATVLSRGSLVKAGYVWAGYYLGYAPVDPDPDPVYPPYDPGSLVRSLSLPLDVNGWTIFTPSADSRIMYVSTTGNNATATIYNSTSNVDPFNPQGTVNAYLTYAAAYANTRAGYPDWVLFKRGDTFAVADVPDARIRNGRSASEPSLISSYGSSGLSPVFKTGLARAINIYRESPSVPSTAMYIAITGLHFYAHTRNPDDPDFFGWDPATEASNGVAITTYNAGNYVHHVLIEGCVCRFYRNNIEVSNASVTDGITDVDIRRCIMLNSYCSYAHSQGFGGAGVNRLLIEENIFDHNGWYHQSTGNYILEGGATFHNHNIYNDGTQNTKIVKNIFLRPSSIGIKSQNVQVGLVIDNNLIADCEVGIEACNNYPNSYYRVHSPIVSNNVFYQLGLSNPTSRNVGWGMWVQGWDGGSVDHNLMLSQRGQMYINLGLRSRDVVIHDNTCMLTGMAGIYYNSAVDNLAIDIHDNYFEMLDSTAISVNSAQETMGTTTFARNNYYGSTAQTFDIGSTVLTFEQWVAQYESNATRLKRTFVDANRTVDTYMGHIGETATFTQFIDMCRVQDRYSWDYRLMADNVNTWIKAGFVTA